MRLNIKHLLAHWITTGGGPRSIVEDDGLLVLMQTALQNNEYITK